MVNQTHRSGFVNIIGHANVGKSTLCNSLMKDRLSIVNAKPQTTRHRILGIISDEHYQVILSDSPGMIHTPSYELQKKMNDYAFSSFEDADVMLFVTDIYDEYSGTEKVIQLLHQAEVPKFLVMNKKDMDTGDKADSLVQVWKSRINFDKIFVISAKTGEGMEGMMEAIVEALPEGPVYYPKDQWTDKPERFFVSEIIRGNIMSQYKQEIPYSCEVVVEHFKHMESMSGPMIHIRANIYVDRKTQKSIIIGEKGSSIKKLGISSRVEMESFFGEKIHLELFVVVKENWRNSDQNLKSFGYQ
ncbi:MAG: GTPase Era [Saprospiraceae bacterium]|nr:GTPase Era [Saprospiraceae bacterium]